METIEAVRLERDGEYWRRCGPGVGCFGVVNEYLGYLADRNYSPRTVRAYGFDLLDFSRWLAGQGVEVAGVNTDVLLGYLAACRQAQVPGRPEPRSSWRRCGPGPRCSRSRYTQKSCRAALIGPWFSSRTHCTSVSSMRAALAPPVGAPARQSKSVQSWLHRSHCRRLSWPSWIWPGTSA